MSIERKVLQSLATTAGVTEWSLMGATGATSAGRRLRELRAAGWDIKSKWEKSEIGARYMRHYMTAKEQQRARKWLKGEK
jgi:hypothetical protein